MQTFLPYADFAATARVLDRRRLGKQRVEALQVLRALTVPGASVGAVIGGGRWEILEDATHDQHTVSPYALEAILGDASGPDVTAVPRAVAGRRAWTGGTPR